MEELRTMLPRAFIPRTVTKPVRAFTMRNPALKMALITTAVEIPQGAPTLPCAILPFTNVASHVPHVAARLSVCSESLRQAVHCRTAVLSASFTQQDDIMFPHKVGRYNSTQRAAQHRRGVRRMRSRPITGKKWSPVANFSAITGPVGVYECARAVWSTIAILANEPATRGVNLVATLWNLVNHPTIKYHSIRQMKCMPWVLYFQTQTKTWANLRLVGLGDTTIFDETQTKIALLCNVSNET